MPVQIWPTPPIKEDNMPKSPVPRGAGNINMKGKKHRMMSCGCCYCIDYREDELKKEHMKEIRSYGPDEI